MEKGTNEKRKSYEELEAFIEQQNEVIADQIAKLELAQVSKKVKAETFTIEGKFYKINYGTLVLPGVEKGTSKTVTAAEVAVSAELQEAFLKVEGFAGFEEIVNIEGELIPLSAATPRPLVPRVLWGIRYYRG